MNPCGNDRYCCSDKTGKRDNPFNIQFPCSEKYSNINYVLGINIPDLFIPCRRIKKMDVCSHISRRVGAGKLYGYQRIRMKYLGQERI